MGEEYHIVQFLYSIPMTDTKNSDSIPSRWHLAKKRRLAAFGIETPSFISWLEAIGIEEYKVRFNSRDIVRALGERVMEKEVGVYLDPEEIRYSYGDILFVEGRAIYCLSKSASFKRYEEIYIRPHSPYQIMYSVVKFFRYVIFGYRLSLGSPPLVVADNRYWINLVVRKTTHRREKECVRIYLPVQWTYKDLFTNLNRENIPYVVLRWWEQLPCGSANQEIDILIDDDYRSYLLTLVNSKKPGSRALDIYTVSGINYPTEETTYYEPEKAREILLSAIIYPPLGCKIPSPYQAFVSLAYHALYHKGFYSGLASSYGKGEGCGKYYDTLKRESIALGISCELSMESLDAYLASVGWRPPLEKLANLSLRNDWIRRHFFTDGKLVFKRKAEKYIGAFILRRECEDYQVSNRVSQLLVDFGFKIVSRIPIAEEKVVEFSEKTRGGNWGSENPPIILIIVYDPSPQWTTVEDRKKEGNISLDNFRMRNKEKIRRILNKECGTRERPWFHGCDNIGESEECIREIAPHIADRLL